ncbi:MAG TPA: hypothetical protein VMH04_09235 [Candidatus Solibacter sp.]|nr:hypothetical protein [Candidatus Solibacter sp.]
MHFRQRPSLRLPAEACIDMEELMKSQKIFTSAVAGLMLLVCSFATAEEQFKPVMRGEVDHSVSRPLREYSPLVRPELGSRIAPTVSGELSFAGQSAAKGILYSDASGAVGLTQYVQLVNDQYTVYDKTTGAVIAGPVAENALWSTFGSSCQTAVGGDGTVTYDQLANVWVLQHHAVPTGGPYLNCVAVSTSSDATGSYYLYGFALTMQYPDKPRLGVWPDAYYISQDLLDPTSKTFIRSQACALNRTAMLAGTFALTVCFQGSISLPTFVVTTLDGQTLPPTGEPAFFWQLDQRPSVGRNNLNSFQFHVDFTNINNDTFTGPVANALPAYTDACNNFKPCIPQPNTTNLLQGWGDRLNGRVVYRNFGTYESVVMTHAVTRGTGTAAHAAIRWYEYRTPLTPVIFQSGTIAPDNTYRWNGGIAEDQFGDIAVGYNVSSSTVNPGISYSGHASTDRTGFMETEISAVVGGGAQTGTNHNWSSFSSMTVDPVDDCTFYYTTQYYATSSQSGWKTQINSFRFPSCTN